MSFLCHTASVSEVVLVVERVFVAYVVRGCLSEYAGIQYT